MKKLIIIVLIIITTTLFAGEYDFTLSVQNQQVSGSNLIFDVYMLSTGDQDIYLGDSDFAFNFNNENFSNPVASVLTAATTIWDYYTVAASIVSTDRIILNIQKPNWNDQTQFESRVQVIETTGNGTLIGQIQISNISNTSGTAGLIWRTSGANVTIVNRIDNSTPWNQYNIDSFASYTAPDDASLPVELASFTAVSKGTMVELQWETASETDNLGFIIERCSDDKEWQPVASYKSNKELEGQGTSPTSTKYSYIDHSVTKSGVYSYRICDVNTKGRVNELSSTTVDFVALPTTTKLFMAYPNPFNPATTLDYQLAKDSQVSITVYDMLGREVKTLINKQLSAGEYSVAWNATDNTGLSVPSGIYLVRMQADNTTQIHKVSLIK